LYEFCLEVAKVNENYYVLGYVTVLGGPYVTEEQAIKRVKYLEKKWHIQTKY
tara:strand:+ start:71 stop:226 length:156 start_codon:yes stop_codon:yes gene_type:complete